MKCSTQASSLLMMHLPKLKRLQTKLLKNIKYLIPESTLECPYKDTREELANNICLSSNDCNVCKRTNGVHEGCNHPFSTLKPVCDLDKDTTAIDDTATRKVAVCVGCKKTGNYGHFLAF